MSPAGIRLCDVHGESGRGRLGWDRNGLHATPRAADDGQAGRDPGRGARRQRPGRRPGDLSHGRERTGAACGRARRERTPPRGAVDAWLWALGHEPAIDPGSAGLATFREQYRRWTEGAAALAVPDTFRLCFRLDPPVPGGSDPIGNGQTPGATWTLQYLLQATDDPSLLVPAADVWRERGATARLQGIMPLRVRP